MTDEDRTKQDLLTLVQARNQRIAELELQILNLNRNQCNCEGDCKKEEENAEG